MKMREIAIEVMRERGVSQDEINAKEEFASTMVPDAGVRTDVPDYLVPVFKELLNKMYDDVKNNPEAAKALLDAADARIRRRN